MDRQEFNKHNRRCQEWQSRKTLLSAIRYFGIKRGIGVWVYGRHFDYIRGSSRDSWRWDLANWLDWNISKNVGSFFHIWATLGGIIPTIKQFMKNRRDSKNLRAGIPLD